MSSNTSGADDPPDQASKLVARIEFADILVGLCLLALSLLFYFEGQKLGAASGPEIGPASFPTGLALLLGAAASLLILSSGVRLVAAKANHMIEIRRPLRVLGGMALLLAFPVLMERLGYYLAMGAFLAVFLVLADYRRPLGIVVAVASFLAMSWLVFAQILKIPLP